MTGRRSPGALLAWLLVAVAGCVALLVALDLIFVHTTRGQWVDDASLRGTAIGRAHIINPVNSVLNVVSVTALGLATVAVGAVGYLRRRPILALLTMLLVVGSTGTTEVLKHVIFTRPLFDPRDPLPFNTLPSGHTTVALSVGVAFTLVAAARWRVLVAVIGAVYGGTTGVATMSAGWHRPSDAVASVLLVGAWAGVGGLLLLAVQRSDDNTAPVHHKNLISTVLLALAGLALIAVAVAALHLTDEVTGVRPDDLSRQRLLAAYGGAAAGIAGATSLVMAAFLVTLHRIVPPRGPASADDSDETTEVLVAGGQST
jgi:membrane-associated phospholipid phosphatase